MVVFDNYLDVDIEHQPDNQDKCIDNRWNPNYFLVDIEINSGKENLHMLLMSLKNSRERRDYFARISKRTWCTGLSNQTIRTKATIGEVRTW